MADKAVKLAQLATFKGLMDKSVDTKIQAATTASASLYATKEDLQKVQTSGGQDTDGADIKATYATKAALGEVSTALNEQKPKVTELESKVQTLEAAVSELKTKLAENEAGDATRQTAIDELSNVATDTDITNLF